MKIKEALAGVRNLCIDTAPFIYFVERHPVYVDRMHAIFVPVDEGRITAFTSEITLTEALTKPLQTRDKALVKVYQELFLKTHHLVLMPIILTVAEHAAELRASYNLKTPDALQIAAAIYTGCNAFLTNDPSLKRVREVRVLVLDDLEPDVR